MSLGNSAVIQLFSFPAFKSWCRVSAQKNVPLMNKSCPEPLLCTSDNPGFCLLRKSLIQIT